jgi:tRNA-specific 2-thiouridylase
MVAAGHQVEGVFLRLWDPLGSGKGSRCCSLEDQEDARAVAAALDIPLREECTSRRFFDDVFEASLERYAEGLTPNPCVVCNEKIKFTELEAVADAAGADVLVTGHYARLRGGKGGRVRLLRGVDAAKDQSYFLHRLTQDRLRRVLFPLGDMTKADVRRKARAAGLPVADKPESQELCFVPEGTSYAELMEAWLPGRVRAGEIVDRGGRRLGSHAGVHRFTVGQRRGLGVSAEMPLYVLQLHPATGTVVVGDRDELLTSSFEAEDMRWISDQPPARELECSVQVRSRHRAVPARVEARGEGVLIVPEEPLTAPAPGQAAVLYDGDEVLGGGWITAAGR